MTRRASRRGESSGVRTVVRPAAAAVLVWATLWAFRHLWVSLTAIVPSLDDPEPFRMIDATQFGFVSVIDAALVVVLLVDGLSIRRSPPELRRGHQAGLVLSLALVALVQLGAYREYEAWRFLP